MSTVVAAYTNAVLIALLPYVSDFSSRLSLEVSVPITTNHVRTFTASRTDVGGALVLTNGMRFRFDHGRVDLFQSALRRQLLDHPGPVGQSLRLSQEQAVEKVRRAITCLGYDAERLNIDLPPRVRAPGTLRGRLYALYYIEWCKINRPDVTMVESVVNGDSGDLEELTLYGVPWVPAPKLAADLTITDVSIDFEPFTDSEKAELILSVLPQFASIAQKLNLPVTSPLSTNQVIEFNAAWEHQGKRMSYRITLTNGYSFGGHSKGISGFAAPDAFFVRENVRARDFKGMAKMSSRSAAALARRAVAKLGYPPEVLSCSGTPERQWPFVVGPRIIPRCEFTWSKDDPGGSSFVSVEVDLQQERVTMMNFTSTRIARDLPKRDPSRKVTQ